MTRRRVGRPTAQTATAWYIGAAASNFEIYRAESGEGGLWITDGRHHLAAYRDAPALYIERVAGFYEAHLPTQAQAPSARLA